MTVYYGVPKFPTAYELPDANSPFNPSTVNPPVEGAIDAITALQTNGFFRSGLLSSVYPYPAIPATWVNSGDFFLQGRLFIRRPSAANGLYLETADSYNRAHVTTAHADPAYWLNRITEGAPTPAASGWKNIAISTSTAARLAWDVDVPDQCTFNSVRVRIEPATGHVGLPQFMPRLGLLVTDLSTGTAVWFGPFVDNSASIAAYEAPHDLVLSGLSFTVLRDVAKIEAIFQPEGGTDSLPDGIVYHPRCTFTRQRIGEE